MAVVSDYMTSDIDLIGPRRTAREAARLMIERDADALVVAEAGHLLGLVTHGDVVRAVAAERDVNATSVAEIMLPEVLFCFADQSLDEAAAKMQASLVRRLPVLSKDKTLLGVIHEDDIRRRAAANTASGTAAPDPVVA
jgi:CBS domain-containing protein